MLGVVVAVRPPLVDVGLREAALQRLLAEVGNPSGAAIRTTIMLTPASTATAHVIAIPPRRSPAD
ncbi:MAG: hypothetical protein JWL94_495 [Microbacteriaceae bacterium]|nr:hypothetical protein [Microbacteriaceae bacterium]